MPVDVATPEVASGLLPEEDSQYVEAEDNDELVALEQEMSRDVPNLLETMNRSSDEVNALERQLAAAQERHKRLLEQWSRVYEDWRAQYGSAIDRAKPYFDAAQVLHDASDRVTAACRDFSTASSQYDKAKRDLRTIEERLAYGAHKVSLDRDQQDGLSRATVQVLKNQKERDRCERAYTGYLREFNEAQQQAEARRSHIGDSAIRRALPCFRQLQQHQSTLSSVQAQINALTEKVAAAKFSYRGSLLELDRISVAIHEARLAHRRSVLVNDGVHSREVSRGKTADAKAHANADAGAAAGTERPPEISPEREDPEKAEVQVLPEVTEVFGDGVQLAGRAGTRDAAARRLADEDDGPFA